MYQPISNGVFDGPKDVLLITYSTSIMVSEGCSVLAVVVVVVVVVVAVAAAAAVVVVAAFFS